MKAKIWFKSIALFGILSLAVFGCRKDDDDNETTSAADNTLAQQTFDDVQSISDQAAEGNLTSFKTGGIASGCATITNDTIAVPHLLTIDFGALNCLCNDGRSRRGQILVSYTGKYKDSASVHTLTFSDYYVNDNHVMGTKTVTNGGTNGNGNVFYIVEVNGSIGLADSSGTLTWVSSRVREWLEGYSTLPWDDDVYSITGTASGTRADGNSFTAEITEALRKEIGCRWIVDGVVEFTPDGKPTRVVDFGDGVCDNQATVTVNGHSFPITLR